MVIELVLLVSYAFAAAAFFAWVGRRNGFWWVAVPLLLAGAVAVLLTTLWLHQSALFTPLALITVACPAVISSTNRSFRYRWWPSVSLGRGVGMTLLALSVLLLLGSISVLVRLAFFAHG